MKEEFKDYTPIGEPFLGDLKFGRCFGKEASKNDYPANRDKEGITQNLPITPLRLIPKKDMEFWNRVRRPNSKHYLNTSSFKNYTLKSIVKGLEKPSGLNISKFKMGKDPIFTIK